MTRALFVMLVVTVVASGAAAAQAPAPTAPATPAPAGAPAAVGAQPADSSAPGPQGFVYDPEGRRDPFVSLLQRGLDSQGVSSGSRPSGLPGLSASEVNLKGTMLSRGGFVAIMQGADSKTYIVHAGDKLFDGTVRTITADAMVILQQVNDPLSLEKQREVRKVLRQTEGAK